MQNDSDTVRRREFAERYMGLGNGTLRVRIKDADGGEVFDATAEVLDLLRANGGWQEPDIERSSLFLGTGREAARAIGQRLYDRHGHEGMVAVHDAVAAFLPRGAGRELEYAWSGIGTWKA